MNNKTFLGVDIGATKTIFILVKINGAKYQPKAGEPRAYKIIESLKVITPRKEAEILKMIEENYLKLAKKYQPKADKPRAYKIGGIGIGFAGPVDFERGAAIMGPNLKTGKIEFKKILERRLPLSLKLRRTRKIPVAVDNDAKCFALAESIFGAAKGYKNIVGLTIGTGIGGGIIIDGKIYRGATGSAGEFGHNTGYDKKDKKYEWEQISSGKGLERVYENLSGKKINSFEIVRLAKSKDSKALETIEIISENLGIGLANILEIFNPEIIVLGGGLAEVDLIVKKAKEYAKKKVFLPSLAKTPIVVSNLGQNAVALGAAWMASGVIKTR